MTIFFFYSMLNIENKIYDQKCFNIVACRISNHLLALKKCRILHIENLSSKEKKSGIKLLMKIMQVCFLLIAFLKHEIENKGQWCKLWDIGQNILILLFFVKVEFIQTFKIHVIFFSIFFKSVTIISKQDIPNTIPSY